MSLKVSVLRASVAAAMLAMATGALAQTFTIKDIRIEGIARTEPGTVLSHLPFQVGDEFTQEKGDTAIHSLYGSGLFRDVRLEQDGDVLVVMLQERPAVASISTQGIRAFDESAIEQSLRDVGMAEGRIFDHATLDRADQELRRQYLARGYYGVEVKEIKRSGKAMTKRIDRIRLCEGDTLVLLADDSFVSTWGESSVFLMIANGKDAIPQPKRGKRAFALTLLILMIVGATIGELPITQEMFPGIKMDMFFFAAVTTVIMAWTNTFPARKYTKFISWDILITIACAFAISKAMTNSGLADLIANFIIGLSNQHGPYVLLAILYIITNLITELITNNAAAALAFPLALSIATQLGVDPMPFFMVICIASSAGFTTPIGYQTNLIVQGIGNYKFTDFVRIGLPLNIIVFLISIFLIPQIWPFEF